MAGGGRSLGSEAGNGRKLYKEPVSESRSRDTARRELRPRTSTNSSNAEFEKEVKLRLAMVSPIRRHGGKSVFESSIAKQTSTAYTIVLNRDSDRRVAHCFSAPLRRHARRAMGHTTRSQNSIPTLWNRIAILGALAIARILACAPCSGYQRAIGQRTRGAPNQLRRYSTV